MKSIGVILSVLIIFCFGPTVLAGSDSTDVKKTETEIKAKVEDKVAEKSEQAETKKEEKKLQEEITTASGLKYVDMVIGDGSSPKIGQQVFVHYTGTLVNGKKFDSSVDRDEPYVFHIGMGEVIKGWDEGIMTMKVGGKRKLIIPPDLAYGKRGFSKVIPPNATLLFDVELLDIK